MFFSHAALLTSIIFENVTPGTWAFIVLHDVNANGRMDFEASGMPTEPYAMSGESMQMGPPSFQAPSFEVGTEDICVFSPKRRKSKVCASNAAGQ